MIANIKQEWSHYTTLPYFFPYLEDFHVTLPCFLPSLQSLHIFSIFFLLLAPRLLFSSKSSITYPYSPCQKPSRQQKAFILFPPFLLAFFFCIKWLNMNVLYYRNYCTFSEFNLTLRRHILCLYFSLHSFPYNIGINLVRCI